MGLYCQGRKIVKSPGNCGNFPFAENHCVEDWVEKLVFIYLIYLFIHYFVYLCIYFIFTLRELFIMSCISVFERCDGGAISIKL